METLEPGPLAKSKILTVWYEVMAHGISRNTTDKGESLTSLLRRVLWSVARLSYSPSCSFSLLYLLTVVVAAVALFRCRGIHILRLQSSTRSCSPSHQDGLLFRLSLLAPLVVTLFIHFSSTIVSTLYEIPIEIHLLLMYRYVERRCYSFRSF